ncbi:MAG: Outer membrane porin protein [Burkholderia lata]|uniref:Outer membrane porin protein n=1 Tax=Burkholderia lata (strain ATCC 17760 / DSM 23089 / LMG 22485 / NCIMB 9086 / R18194 / 383) TaxID=482957 RepID=A0A833UGV5_BURL3|nr:porin [Burkholderia lata]KAF1040134.1 MAG: Outer membrane porin protein [Burkholderia lata]
MKKSHLLVGMLAGMTLTPVWAQSTVTLFGLIDQGIDYTSNVRDHGVTEMLSGAAQGSRWGVRGSEALGGKLSAVFQLENGFDASSGRLMEGGRMFGRQAWVGIAHDDIGRLTFGRQYDSLVEYLAPLTANGNWGGFLFQHPYDNDNTDNSFRLDNAVQFNSSNMGGLQFGATYALSNTPGQISTNSAQSLGVSYSVNGLSLGAAWLNVTNPGATALGAVTTDDAGFVASRHRVYGAGVNYQLKQVTLGFVYTHTSLSDPTAYSYISGAIVPAGQHASTLKFDNFEVNANWAITTALMLGAMYDYTQATLDTSAGAYRPKYHTFGAMLDYAFTKRTDVYAMASYQRTVSANSGTALDQAYAGGADDISSTQRQLVGRVGLRHKF